MYMTHIINENVNDLPFQQNQTYSNAWDNKNKNRKTQRAQLIQPKKYFATTNDNLRKTTGNNITNNIMEDEILPGNMWERQKYKLIPIKQWRTLAITLHIVYIALYPIQWRKCNTIRQKWQKMEGTHQRNNEKRSLYT